jgi:hypothetical protein
VDAKGAEDVLRHRCLLLFLLNPEVGLLHYPRPLGVLGLHSRRELLRRVKDGLGAERDEFLMYPNRAARNATVGREGPGWQALDLAPCYARVVVRQIPEGLHEQDQPRPDARQRLGVRIDE